MRGVWAAACLAVTSCSGRPAAPAPPAPTPAPARAFRVERAEELLRGPAASGRIGDYRLDNGVVAFIVNDIGNPHGFASSGGNVVDAVRLDDPASRDALSQTFLYLDDSFPRQGSYDRLEVRAASGPLAVLVAHGVDSGDDRIEIEQEYRLAAGAGELLLRTTVRNRSADPIAGYELGDVLQWGACEKFLPGLGFLYKGRAETPYLACIADEVTYGFAQAAGNLAGPHGSSWSDVVLQRVTLAPGGTASWERVLVVGRGLGVAAVLPRIFALRGERVSTLRGATGEPDGPAVAGVRVLVDREDGTPVAMAVSGAGGEFSIPVAPGRYRVSVQAPGRTGDPPALVDVGEAPRELPLPVSKPALVAARLRAAEGGGAAVPSPGKLTFLGVDGTPDPMFGPSQRAAGAGNVWLTATGEVTLPVPPGRYRVAASRGPEWGLAERVVEVLPGQTTPVDFELAHVVDTTGYLCGDFHQHAIPSTDSAVTLTDRAIADLGEGLDLLVATDHNEITDYGPVVAELERAAGRPLPIAAVIGVEATSETQGHFNAFPVPRDPVAVRGGAPPIGDADAATILARLRRFGPTTVVQVNHPRAGAVGYFDIAGFDSARDQAPAGMAFDFDAVEVVNGKRVEGQANQQAGVLRDWFWLLDHGHRVTAMGNSDSHRILGEEVGYPRSCLGVGFDDPRRLAAAALHDAVAVRRDVVATNGPFVRLRRGGASVIGATLAGAAGSRVEVELEVQAAPWVDVTRIEVYARGREMGPPIAVTAPPEQVVRYRGTLRLPVVADGWYVVVVRGDRPLTPVVSALRGEAATPIAIANPIWTRVE